MFFVKQLDNYLNCEGKNWGLFLKTLIFFVCLVCDCFCILNDMKCYTCINWPLGMGHMTFIILMYSLSVLFQQVTYTSLVYHGLKHWYFRKIHFQVVLIAKKVVLVMVTWPTLFFCWKALRFPHQNLKCENIWRHIAPPRYNWHFWKKNRKVCNVPTFLLLFK